MNFPATIELAAIRLGGQVHSLSRPARHHDVIHSMVLKGISPEDIALGEQGFTTSPDGAFVPRDRAFIIARDAGQIISGIRATDILFSEDLW